jgi:hypothetical protein
MLSKEQVKEFQDLLGIESGAFEKIINAIKDPGEVKIELPTGKILSDEILLTRDTQMKEEGIKEGKKEGFKEGKDKGIEIQGSVLLTKFGVDPGNIKVIDPDKVAEAIHGAIAKGDTGLQDQVKLLIQERDQVKLDFQAKENELKAKTFDTNLLSSMPVKRNTKLFNDNEYLMTTKSNLEFEEENGIVYPKVKGGDFMRHPDTKEKLPLKEGLEAYYTARGWIETEGNKKEGGRGGKDGLPSNDGITGVRTASQFEAEWKKANPEKVYGQPESVAALMEAAKAAGKGNFDMNA